MKPSIIGRIAGAMSARRAISGYLVAMGQPPAGFLEPLEVLRERYRQALSTASGPEEASED